MKLALYYYDACPFCQRVLHVLPSLPAVQVELKNTLEQPAFREELIEGGGKPMVPCLRIEVDEQVQWMYESLDIIAYLQSLA